MTNLNYHRHLDGIAAQDLEYVRRKDTQYSASWKRRGGVGAFFTFARPWDRLESIMRSTQPAWSQYDVIAAVLVEGLSGPDGSVIACIRDLRRYLLLLEAECAEQLAIERGDKEALGLKRVPRFEVGESRDTMYCPPWRISAAQYREKKAADAWRQLLPELYLLEPAISLLTFHSLAVEVKALYLECSCGGVAGYVLDIERCPPDIRPSYPTFARELNDKEHNDIPEEYRQMYAWYEAPTKWIVKPAFEAWTR